MGSARGEVRAETKVLRRTNERYDNHANLRDWAVEFWRWTNCYTIDVCRSNALAGTIALERFALEWARGFVGKTPMKWRRKTDGEITWIDVIMVTTLFVVLVVIWAS